MSVWIADALVLAGLVVLTLAVYGVARLPDVYLRLHAASKAAFVGLVLLLIAGMVGGDGEILARSVLIVALLSLTTPVAAHVIGQAAARHGEPLRVDDPVDEREEDPEEERRPRDGEPPAG